jgi:hypothetical protein
VYSAKKYDPERKISAACQYKRSSWTALQGKYMQEILRLYPDGRDRSPLRVTRRFQSFGHEKTSSTVQGYNSEIKCALGVFESALSQEPPGHGRFSLAEVRGH